MRICVFGAGAVGGYLAGQFIRSGQFTVSLVARGENLEAIRRNGLRLVDGDDEVTARPDHATHRPADLELQDIVFVTLKAPALPAAAASISRLLKPGGCAVFITNGVPWWWQFGERENPQAMSLVDPHSTIWNEVGPQRAIGCLVYSMNEVVEPGVVIHHGNNRWILGEPDNTLSPRVLCIRDILREAGLGAEATKDIRFEVWAKLLRNVSLNPLSALTRLTVAEIAQSAELSQLSRGLSVEVVSTAAAMGWDISSLLQSQEATLKNGGAIAGGKTFNVKPSMLHDVLGGRPMEVDAIVGEVQQFARTHGVATPLLDTIVTLINALDGSPTERAIQQVVTLTESSGD
jgi:2-dehydropantoate 2-reductase